MSYRNENEEITIVQKQRELAVEARKKLNLVSPARDIVSTNFWHANT